jgi:hypothetical protein
MAEKQFQVMRPDGLIDETRESRQEKYEYIDTGATPGGCLAFGLVFGGIISVYAITPVINVWLRRVVG